MPKAGVPQARARREATAAKAEARRPVDGDEKAQSVLARFMRRPSKEAERALRAAASAGELTTHDVQAALAQDIVDITRLAKATLEDVEVRRPLYVARQRALKLLCEVIELAPSGGAAVVVQLIWPAEYAAFDPGDVVKTKDDDEPAASSPTATPSSPPTNGWD